MDEKTLATLAQGILRLSLTPPPRFSKLGNLPFKEWKVLFCAYVKEGGFNDKESISKFISLLDGDALSVVFAIPNRDALSLDDFIKEVEKRLVPAKDPREFRHRFQVRLHMQNESVQCYADQLASLAKDAFPTYSSSQQEDMVVEKLLSTVRLPASTTRAALYQEQFSKVSDVVDWIQRWIAAEKYARRSDYGETSAAVNEEPVAAVQKGKGANCYFCKEYGHLRSECPKLKRIKCYNCGMFGHLSKGCKNNRNSGNDRGVGRVSGPPTPRY